MLPTRTSLKNVKCSQVPYKDFSSNSPVSNNTCLSNDFCSIMDIWMSSISPYLYTFIFGCMVQTPADTSKWSLSFWTDSNKNSLYFRTIRYGHCLNLSKFDKNSPYLDPFRALKWSNLSVLYRKWTLNSIYIGKYQFHIKFSVCYRYISINIRFILISFTLSTIFNVSIWRSI